MNVQIFVYSTYAIFERMFKILRIQQTQIVKEFTLFCMFKVRNFSKNIHNSLDSTYTSYRKVYTLFFLSFFNLHNISTNAQKNYKFNVHNFSKNVWNSALSTT